MLFCVFVCLFEISGCVWAAVVVYSQNRIFVFNRGVLHDGRFLIFRIRRSFSGFLSAYYTLQRCRP